MSEDNKTTLLNWALYNPAKSWCLANLSAREARAVVKTLSTLEQKSLYLTREKEKRWYKLDESFCEAIRNDQNEFNLDLIKYPEIRGLEDQETSQTTIVQTNKTPKVFLERKFERVFIQVPIEIHVGQRQFRSITEDISEGGIRCKDILPDWVAGYFAIVLKPQNHPELELHCSIVEDQKTDRYRIEIVSLQADPKFISFCGWLATKKV